MTLEGVTDLGNHRPVDVAFQLMADWWMNTFQALVDAAGSDQATKLIAPYHKNSGTAAVFILTEAFQLKQKDRFDLSFLNKVAMDFFTRSDGFRLDIKERGAIGRIKDCPFRNAPSELCQSVCGHIPQHYIDAYGLPIDTFLTSSLSRGDPECQWNTCIRDGEKSQRTDDLGETIANPLPVRYEQGQMNDFSLQYLAEFWVMSARALIDHLGEEQATLLLNPYFKHNGLSFGMRMKRSIREENVRNLLLEVIQNIYGALGMKGEPIENRDGSGMRIDNCPFKDAPVCICSQLSSFCSGICEAIDPECRFSYQRMMTKGDDSCQWSVLRKEAEGVKRREKVAEEIDSDDPLKTLTLRFIKGEITEQELESKLNALRRMGLIK